MRPTSAALTIRAGSKPSQPIELIRKPCTPASENSSFHKKFMKQNQYYREKVTILSKRRQNFKMLIESENCNQLFLQGKNQLNLEINAAKKAKNAIVDPDLVDRFSPRQKEQIITDKFGSQKKQIKENPSLFQENVKYKDFLARYPCKEEVYAKQTDSTAKWN